MPHDSVTDMASSFWARQGLCESFFRNSPDPAVISDENGGIIDCSDTACKLFGYSCEEMVSLAPFGLFADSTRTHLPEILQEENVNKGIRTELLFLKKDGSVFKGCYHTKIIANGTMSVRWATIHDRSFAEAPSSEMESVAMKTMDWLKDYIPEIANEREIILETDASGRVVFANDVYYEKTGFTKKITRNGMKVFDLLPAEMHAKVTADFVMLERGEKVEGNEYEILTKRGDRIPIIATIAPMMRNGVSKVFRATAIDITDHKNSERELLILEKIRVLGELSGGVVHDFKNILAIILGYTEILPDEFKNTTCGDIIAKISRAALDGVEIVKRIQQFTMDNETQAAECLSLNDIVLEMISLGEPKWKDEAMRNGKTISIITDLADIPPVTGQASELREVIGNFLNNAVEAIVTNGVITISTSDNGDFITLNIADTGCGMDNETKNRAFEPFYTTKGARGTGLGMSVSHGIIQKMGGDITLESEEGRGTTVSIFLPVCPREECADDRCSINEKLSSRPAVLVVDDEDNIREILREFLKNAGFSPSTAQNVDEGLALFRDNRFFAVITDLNMPEKSGWILAKEVKTAAPSTVIVMLSGWESEAEEMNRREKYVDIVMPKPIDFPRLISYLNSHRQ